FLLHVGIGTSELRRAHGHNLRATFQACRDRGLPDVRSVRFCARLLDDVRVTTRYRYIETGTTKQPALASLNQACEGLRDHVYVALKAAGERVHSPRLYFGDDGHQVPDRWRLFAQDRQVPPKSNGPSDTSTAS
ncbi:MAG: hypothetical protein RLN96_02270, partial [Pseudomonadales bacterium]